VKAVYQCDCLGWWWNTWNQWSKNNWHESLGCHQLDTKWWI